MMEAIWLIAAAVFTLQPIAQPPALAESSGLYADAPLNPMSGVTIENFRRLKPGMTLEEVEAILGPGWLLGNLPGGFLEAWPGDQVGITLIFGLDKLLTGQLKALDWDHIETIQGGIGFYIVPNSNSQPAHVELAPGAFMPADGR
jgi:hypothetical protein